MQLSSEQIEAYQRDGYLILPELFTSAEVALLRVESDRLEGVRAEAVRREHNGRLRSVLRVHASDGPTASPGFRALSLAPRLVQPARELTGSAELYIWHTKLNLKPAFEGGIYAWHQDYGTWQRDGAPAPRMVTAMVMLDDAAEISGALYFIPGSHRLGHIRHVHDAALQAINPDSLPRERLAEALRQREPVAVTGKAGTVALFHADLMHGSGHNMSAGDRRQIYVAYNPVDNHPRNGERDRPEWVCARDFTPLTMGRDGDLLELLNKRGAAVAPMAPVAPVAS